MCWQRARSAEQKAVRCKEILDAAYCLFEKDSYENISLNGIARCAGISKPNIYRYFSSREEIFLKIIELEFMAWIDLLNRELHKIDQSSSSRDIALVFADVTAGRNKLLRLAPYLTVSLEKNASFEEVYRFKKKLHESFDKLFKNLENRAPQFFSQEGKKPFVPLLAIITGLSPMAFRSKTLRKVLELPEFSSYQREFRDVLAETLEVMLLGMERFEQ